MPIPVVLSYTVAYFSLIVAAAVLLRDWQSFVHRIFAAGMALFAAEELCFGFIYGALLSDDILFWQKRVLVVGILLPSIWLAFSVTYARVNPRQYLSQWRWVLAAAILGPVGFLAVFRTAIFIGAIYLESSERWS